MRQSFGDPSLSPANLLGRARMVQNTLFFLRTHMSYKNRPRSSGTHATNYSVANATQPLLITHG